MFPFFKNHNEELQAVLKDIHEKDVRQDVKQMALALQGQLSQKIDACVVDPTGGPRGAAEYCFLLFCIGTCFQGDPPDPGQAGLSAVRHGAVCLVSTKQWCVAAGTLALQGQLTQKSKPFEVDPTGAVR